MTYTIKVLWIDGVVEEYKGLDERTATKRFWEQFVCDPDV